MGLLDEAIREHLDLKRKRGADPTEVSREEHEALGPAVRQPVEAGTPSAPAGAAPPTEKPAAAEAPHRDEAAPEPEAAGEHVSPMPGEQTPNGAAAPAIHHEPAPPVPDPEAPAPSTPEPPGPPASAGQETEIFDVDDVFAEEEKPAEEPADEDVLEETPEFLQETPEHDRLWFEQKPPKDFDFDG